MSKIKVVLWDVDGTLLNFKAAEKATINTCFEKQEKKKVKLLKKY